MEITIINFIYYYYLTLGGLGFGGLSLRVLGVIGRLYVHTLVLNLLIKLVMMLFLFFMMLFLVTIWCCLPACEYEMNRPHSCLLYKGIEVTDFMRFYD
mgnify:CR=1 FL=1